MSADVRSLREALYPDKTVRRAGRQYRVGRKGGLSVRDDGVFHDFSTGASGDAVELVREARGCDHKGAFQFLRSHGWTVPEPASKRAPAEKKVLRLPSGRIEDLKEVVAALRLLERAENPNRLDLDAYQLRRREYRAITGASWPFKLREVSRG